MNNKTIKVLHIGLSSNTGGIETVVNTWVNQKPENIQFDFINLEDVPLAYEENFLNHDCEIYRITPRSKNPFQNKKELEDIIKNGNYDYVHHHVMSLSYLTPLEVVNELGSSKCILHSHTIVSHLSLKYIILNIIGSIKIKHLKFLELACGKEAGFSMFNNNNFDVINNGIDFDKFKFDKTFRNEIRDKHKIKDNELIVGHIGRHGPQKNYPFIISSFGELVKINDNAKLILIGDVDKDDEVQSLIKKYNLQDKVICTGKVSDTYKYYSAMDLFYMPSLYEGISVAMIEAQANGLPCIVSDNIAKESSISDLVQFIDIGNPKEAAIILNTTLSTTHKRESSQINKEYDIKNTSKKMFEFYKENLKKDF